MKNAFKTAIALAIVLGSFGTVAQAAVEDLAADNSTYSSAQDIGDLSAQGLINVFGFRGSVFGGSILDDSDADYYSFVITSPSILKLNVFTPSGPSEDNDPVLGLYDASGNQLMNDDDGGAGYDAFLQYEILTAGTYIAAVSGYDDFSFNGVNAETDFPYTLQLEATAQIPNVPLPATFWLMATAIAGLGALGRKRIA